MTGASGALVIDSFLPWYVVRWSSTRFGGGQVTQHESTASAWAASTGWSAGIVLALIAAATWLLWPRRFSPRLRIAGAVGAALAGVVTTVATLLAVGNEPDGGSLALALATADGPGLGEIVRDTLNGGTAGWACYLGVLLMLTIAVCAFAAGRGKIWG
jgi:hypothetical protein